MFSCEQHCNIVPQYCNFDRQIVLSDLQPTRTSCKLVEIHKRFVKKASDWTTRKRKHQSSCSDYLIRFPLSYNPIRGFVYKSFVNFNLQFVRRGCKLFRAICLSKLQYCGTILQCCLQENIRFDCNCKFSNFLLFHLSVNRHFLNYYHYVISSIFTLSLIG